MTSSKWKGRAGKLALFGAGVAAGILGVAGEIGPGKVRRVETIAIDPSDCKLRWTASRGEMRSGQFVQRGALEEYEIDFHAAEMKRGKIMHRFSEQEAANVHPVMQAVIRYAAESVEWFDQKNAAADRAAMEPAPVQRAAASR